MAGSEYELVGGRSKDDPTGVEKLSPYREQVSTEEDKWPVWAQFTLAMTALLFGGLLMVGLPVLSASYLGKVSGDAGGVHVWAPMIATLLGLTTMTVAGIFLFMTFRIDRGVRLRTIRLAERAIDEYLTKELRENASVAKARISSKAKEAEEDINRIVVGLEAMIEKTVKSQVTPQLLQPILEELPKTDAYGQLVIEMVRRFASETEPREARSFVRALIKALRAVLAQMPRSEADSGWWHRFWRRG